MREWARQLCWKGAPVLAVGDAMSPVAELFGTIPKEERLAPAHGRLADVHSASEGLFAGLPSQFRLALPRGERFDRSELSAEFSTTAWSRDGELIGASHVFRPVHLLHPAALDNDETRPIVLENLTRMLRENGGRAF
jgi:anthranilate/para-aminobenzoate synthase component II